MKQSKPLLCLLSLALCFSPALAFATVNEGSDTAALLEVADDAQDLDGASDAVEPDIVDEGGEVYQSTIVEEEAKADSPVLSDEESDATQVDVDEDANGLAEKPAASTEGAIADSAVNDGVQNDVLASDNAALADADQSDSSDLPESWKDANPPVVKSLGGLNGVVFSVGDTIKVEGMDIADADGIEPYRVYYYFESVAADPEGYSSSVSVNGEWGTQVESTFRPGSYRLDHISLTDEKGYNWAIVPEGDGREWGSGTEVIRMAIPDMQFKIEASLDPNPPVVKSLGGLNGVVFSVGDTIKVEGMDIADADGIEPYRVYYYFESVAADPEGYSSSVSVNGEWGTQVESTFRPGSYRLDHISLTDEKGYNWAIVPEGDGREWGFGVEVIQMALPKMNLLLGDKEKENFYKPLEGNNSTYEKGSDAPFSVRFDGPLEEFALATLNGKLLLRANYDLTSGSTIITLHNSMLDSLAPGTYELVAWFNDGGNGVATFTVEGDDKDSVTDIPAGNGTVAVSNGSNPSKVSLAQAGDKSKKPALAQTGDNANTALPSLFAVASLICFMVVRSRIRANSR